MPTKRNQQSSAGSASVVDPIALARAIAAMRGRRPKALINIRSELDINTGEPKNMDILIAELSDSPKPPFVPACDFHFSDCGKSDKLNIHVGLRASHISTTMKDYLQEKYETDDYCQYILESLIANRPDLKHLEVMIELRRDEDIRRFKPYLETNPKPINVPIFLNYIQVEVPGISTLHLPQWKYFLEQQQNLETLICNFGTILWTFYIRTIIRNARTLQKVVLRRIRTFDPSHPDRFTPFNGELFANCRKLKYLKMTCVKDDSNSRYLYKKNYGVSTTGNARPEDKFTHFNFRSINLESLEEIHLYRVKIDIKDLQWVKSEGDNLKLICMECSDMEFYDGDIPDKKNNSSKDKNWGYKGFVSYENYNFDVLGQDKKLLTPICVVIVTVCILILISIVLAVIYFCGYDSSHHNRRNNLSPLPPSRGNKTTNSSLN